MLPSDWDEDKEYTFNDLYNSNDNDNASKSTNNNNIDDFEDINADKLDNLCDNKTPNENETNNEENIKQTGVPENNVAQNVDQPGVHNDVAQAGLQENIHGDNITVPNIIEDDATDTIASIDRPEQEQRTVERLTYDTLGETHQQVKQCHNIMSTDASSNNDVEYMSDKADILGRIMLQIHELAKTKGLSFLTTKVPQFAKFVAQFAQQYNYNKGIKMFKKRGKDAVYAELDQLHRCICFTPISVKDMTKIEKKQAQIMLMLLSEKSSREVKGQGVYNGKNTHNWVSREDKASLTATNKGIL